MIRYLLEKEHEVVIAATGPVAVLLRSNFPEVPIVPLRGYEIRYSSNRFAFIPGILVQVPKILRAIRYEQRWLRTFLEKEAFDLVVSDNRYGLTAAGVPTVILTHQLRILSGWGTWPDRVLQKFHFRLLEQFAACWVVDRPGEHNLGGRLSHPGEIPRNARYIGLLSQLAAGRSGVETEKGKILVLLSGPEPLRELLETKLLAQLSALKDYRFVLAAGKPIGKPAAGLPTHVQYHPYLNAPELESVIRTSELVICRSGYSTLMDLALLGKKALLIPTPGQTEQEYLARLLRTRGVCLFRTQQEVDLETHIPEALAFPGFADEPPEEEPHRSMRQVLDETLLHLPIQDR